MEKFLDGEGLLYFWEKIKAYVNSHAGGGGGTPSGCILIWSGTANAIPSGWALCDGNNGTPNLRDRFVLGAGVDYAVGATGGEETHTLTISEMPEHFHSFYHRGSTVNAVRPNAGTTNTTSVTSNSSTLTETQATGGSGPHNNMPPYYALCYIMKL